MEYNHISIVEVGGITFDNFIPLFLGTKNKLLCYRDCDYKYCIKINNDTILKDGSLYFSHLKEIGLSDKYTEKDNIRMFTQKHYGSTFENELFLDNYDNIDVLVCLFNIVSPEKVGVFFNKNNFSLIECNKNLTNIGNAKTQEKIEKFIKPYFEKYQSSQCDDEKKLIEKLFFANLFLDYARSSKGDLALKILTGDLIEKILVPTYIREGLEWLKG